MRRLHLSYNNKTSIEKWVTSIDYKNTKALCDDWQIYYVPRAMLSFNRSANMFSCKPK